MKEKQTFFDFAAEVGLTKHIGGVAATESMIYLCHIKENSYVLDVGCGVGVTASYLARKTGCRVMGIDIVEGMVDKSRQRAEREGLTSQVEFRVADVQDLPFDDETFDAVISESVTAFPENKARAVQEYARVTRPGGFVGLNETTWIKYPPPDEIVEWVSQDIGMSAMPQTAEKWVQFLQGAGLIEIHSEVDEVNIKDESRGILQRYGCGGLLGILGRTFALYIKNPEYRKFVKSTQEQGVVPESVSDYFGYGLYIGKKS